jgi:hypothetical protein
VSVAIPEAEPHVEAIVALLTGPMAALPTPIPVYRGGRAGDAPCLVVWSSLGDIESSSLAHQRDYINLEFQLSAVGTGPEQATWIADKARAVLLPAALAVTGRQVWRIHPVQAPPDPIRDDDVQPPLWVMPVRYTVRSGPA